MRGDVAESKRAYPWAAMDGEHRESTPLIPFDALALPVALLRANQGFLRVEVASNALLAQAGLAPGDGVADSLRFTPLSGSLEADLAPLEQGADEVVIEVVGLGSVRSLRGRLALRPHGELLVGVWTGREIDWRFEQIVQESPDTIVIVDRQFRHTFANEALRAASGLEPSAFEGKTHRDLGMSEEVASYFETVFQRVFETGEEGEKEFEFTNLRGELRSYASRIVPLIGPDGTCDSLLSCSRDVTDRKREEQRRLEMERKLQETQRLESLGLLAGGAAHDFNNLLTGIMGMTSLVQQRLDSVPSVQPLLSNILLSCERAASLCTQMLAYAQLQHVSIEVVSVRALLELTCDLACVSKPKNVHLSVQMEPADKVRADRSQIQQVLLNLLLNAVESIESQAGEVHVRTYRPSGEELRFRDAAIVPADPSCELLAIEVADTGVGMDPSALARIFEPFFTTKFTGRGLGLAATLGIVRAHGGGLTVRSTPGKGSTFTLYLALSTRNEVERVAPPLPKSGEGRILVVDDEPTVCETTAQLLKDSGYEVKLASSGNEALCVYDADPEWTQLVLLDITMPGLDGFETLAELRKRNAGLPVVLMSGYTEENVRDRAALDPAIRFLQKPFRKQRLLAVCLGATDIEPE